jgi:hypothetical protein
MEERTNHILTRWHRIAQLVGSEAATEEINFDLSQLKLMCDRGEICYPELTTKEHNQLYHILKSRKSEALSVKWGVNKLPCTFRLSQPCREKLDLISSKMGVPKTTILENLVMNCKVSSTKMLTI